MKTIYESLKFIVKDSDKYVDGFHEYNGDIPNLPQRLNRALKVIKPTSLFILNEKPIILFFDKSATKEKVFKKCWNFGEAPIIIIENENDFDIYNGFDYIIKDKSLTKLDNDDINYLSLISGRYFENSKTVFEKKDNKLDTHLLKNIKDAREKLLKLNLEKNINIANALLGRIIFIRYLIDRKVSLKFEGKHQPLANDDLKEILSSKIRTYKLFKYLKSKDGFNGDWFPIDDNEDTLVQQPHLNILKDLISGTEIKTGQRSLFDIYDFSIIPIEFISNVYESFIGEEKQKKSGAYYTPTFLVDYILKYTVDEFFKNNPQEYNCRVLDPACGSGIFLVETLRKLIVQYEKVTKNTITSEEIKKLVKDNIYGIDYNINALQISVFSLYLTMLDYQNPSDIEKFKFPYLLKSDKNKNPNFFENDFFDVDAEYNRILKDKKLDFIIGNPPYGKSTIVQKSFADKYIKLNKIAIANRDIVQPFMVRVKDLVVKNTKISFIVTSKVLYNLQTKEFRTKYFFNQFKINHILELSSVRKEIFENANVPVSILFYEYSNEEEILKNSINYISMKPSPYFEKLKLLLLSKSDLKKVNQSKLLENDYLWRILIYGSYLDFNFIKRLKSFDTLSQHIQFKAQGVIVGNQKESVIEYLGMPYIKAEQFQPFCVKDGSDIWKQEFIERKRIKKVFEAPSLLISQGIDINLNLKIGILKKDAIFTSTISSIKVVNENILYEMMGILNSSFFKYFVMSTASSLGIEREKLLDSEKFSIPYIHNSEVIQSAKDIEKYSKNDFAQYDKEFNDLKDELNKNVLNSFGVTNQEKVLIDYTNNITIPWIMQKNYGIAFKPYDYEDKKIEAYANIFIKHYSKIYKEINKYFKAEILWDEYAIGIYFKVIDKKPKSQIVWKKEKSIQNFLKLSSEKTLENLFIQKDIKGFESDGFYVVKPNEYKNWHEAIGYLDFYEFQDAILRAGKKQCLN
jgi:hypothetical protein